MSPREAIAECQQARDDGRETWSIPLLACLNDPPGNSSMIAWLCSCVGDLLGHLGQASVEFNVVLSLAHRYATSGGDPDEVERQAWRFWTCRSPEHSPEFHAHRAVAQLLFMLARYDRATSPIGRFATPICLLETAESKQGEVFNRVIAHFPATPMVRPSNCAFQ